MFFGESCIVFDILSRIKRVAYFALLYIEADRGLLPDSWEQTMEDIRMTMVDTERRRTGAMETAEDGEERFSQHLI